MFSIFSRIEGGSTPLHLEPPKNSLCDLILLRKFNLELLFSTQLTQQPMLENNLRSKRYKIPKQPFEIARILDPYSLNNLIKVDK